MANAFLTTQPLDIAELVSLVRAPNNGGYVTFMGDVRDNDDGEEVCEIEYVAYDALARKELMRIVDAAEERWPHCACAAAHRTGVLQVGETSVAIAVGAPHRAEAFDACRWIIDTLKTEIPIWKREEFAVGGRVWIEGRDRIAAENGALLPEFESPPVTP